MCTFNPHKNETSNGVVVTLGMRVLDYNHRVGRVVADNDQDGFRCCHEREHVRKNDMVRDPNVCDKYCDHDHWFIVEEDDNPNGRGMFNGSRLKALSNAD